MRYPRCHRRLTASPTARNDTWKSFTWAVEVTVDYADYDTPQANASRIAVTGAPLLNLHNNIANTGAQTLAANTSVQAAQVQFNQPSYSLFLSFNYLVAGTFGIVKVGLDWQDAPTTETVWSDNLYLPGGNTTPDIWLIRGPCLGNQLTVNLLNLDAAQQLTYSVFAWQISQVLPRLQVRYSAVASVMSCPGFSLPDASDHSSGLLGQRQNAALGIGASDGPKLIPTNPGKVFVFANSTSGAADLTVTINAVEPTSMTNQAVALLQSDANGHINQEIWLPGSACTVNMTNHNAAVKSCDWAIVAADY